MRWIDMPPVWLVAALALAWAQARFAPVLSFGRSGDVVGAVLVAAGIVLIGAAAWEFRKARTTIVPGEEPSAMVTTGVYAFSRNPIYLADALILTGLSFRWDAILGLLLVPLFMALITRRFIFWEEARLGTKFPEAFEVYTAQVRRWL